MKKDHRENTVGPWAAAKLDALEAYLKFYGTALSKQSFTRVYIDAFAGACVTKVRTSNLSVEHSPFFDEADDTEAQEEFILGSPVRALHVPYGFHRHYFFDLDETRAETLRAVTEGRKDVTIQVGDCNPLIRNLAPSLKARNVRGVAFLDPYGAHLEWSTVEALAETGTMEVVINFPLAMAINRLITRSGDVPERWADQLTACFGTDEWRKIAYSRKLDLFGNEVTTKNGNVAERLLDLYFGRLKKLFPYVAKPHLIRNTRKAPLYYLIWAGPNKLGLTGADYILRQGETVHKR
ncbi:tcm_partner: three-Cys-motif partner protein [Roseovarius mucosus]|jgi:three-Cys-motif partner protein|uniref:Tcm_partner: three-Cys-motif partner protein n=1 Tax=Roseovarius mucosus TaxID=215743 RepID=A0A1V0RPR6_9RHOB|nr:three-Cys-motif partner protein TcmP [Roseovarius mucosus]ARE83764.1 tcm_partner: three-Cys-motif partner protein [Roseovarius mucosus]